MIAILLVMLLQSPRQRAPRPTQTPNAPVQNSDAVATFEGMFKSADKKHVFVVVENGQTMQLFITASTKFIEDGKPVKPTDFHSGQPVTVDAARDARFNLIAVRIENSKAPAHSPDSR